jgi:dynein heavy chain, axonemal
MPSTAFPVPVL